MNKNSNEVISWTLNTKWLRGHISLMVLRLTLVFVTGPDLSCCFLLGTISSWFLCSFRSLMIPYFNNILIKFYSSGSLEYMDLCQNVTIWDLWDMSLSKLWETVRDREARCAAVHGVSKATRLSDWAEQTMLPALATVTLGAYQNLQRLQWSQHTEFCCSLEWNNLLVDWSCLLL